MLFLGRDDSGKKRYKWHSIRGTKRDAERELTRLLNDLYTGAYVEPTRLTVAEYLDKWLADYAKMSATAKSFERYAEIVEKHLVPALGPRTLTKLQPLQIQEYYSRALHSGRRDGKGGLSVQTVLHHHRVLREALRQAVRWQLLARNPADAVESPRPIQREMRALDEKQTARLLKAADGTRLYLPILLAVTTGMRRGEILRSSMAGC